MYFSRFKIWSIFSICFLSVIFALPNFLPLEMFPQFLQNKINLGLELRGGAYLQMAVDLDANYREQLSFLQKDLKKNLRKEKIKFYDFKQEDKLLLIKISHANDADRLREIIQKIAPNLMITAIQENEFAIQFDPLKRKQEETKIIDQCINVVRKRVDETGTKEPEIHRQGEHRITLQLPGVDNPDAIKKLVGQTGRLVFKRVKEVLTSHSEKSLEPNEEMLSDKNQEVYYILDKEVLLTGDRFQEVRVGEVNGENAVLFRLDPIGATKFYEITSELTGKKLAIVMDNIVVSAPEISGPILGGEASITGRMSIRDASKLRLILSSGSLPAPLKVIEERVVGPSLGNDSIKSGVRAVVIAFALVMSFMIVFYRLFGFFACISLLFNLFFLISALTLLKATLTLPGIAGIALTIGMAVDANVLIYERIKEELKAGSKPLMAIVNGFDRASTAIIDGNLTTLIASAVLYEFGSGSIKGFAVTLGLGIIISMFTALTLTYLQIYFWSRNKRLEKISLGWS